MFHTLYCTTNNLNGKIYVGVHSTNNPLDSYLGTGTALLQAIEKYGRENFTKRILAIFPTKELAFQAEKQIVDEAFISRRDTYNARVGGDGGFSVNDEVKRKLSQAQHNRWSDPDERAKTGASVSKSWEGREASDNVKSHLRALAKSQQHRIQTPSGIFESVTLAADALGTTKGNISYRLRSPNHPDYRRLGHGESTSAGH